MGEVGEDEEEGGLGRAAEVLPLHRDHDVRILRDELDDLLEAPHAAGDHLPRLRLK